MAVEVRFVCTGGCGGEVTQAEYDAGKTSCGADTCSKYGQPFEKRWYCTDCAQFVEGGHGHDA